MEALITIILPPQQIYQPFTFSDSNLAVNKCIIYIYQCYRLATNLRINSFQELNKTQWNALQ